MDEKELQEIVEKHSSDFKIFINPRYNTKNTHGTGCTLSSAITTFFHVEKVLRKLVT